MNRELSRPRDADKDMNGLSAFVEDEINEDLGSNFCLGSNFGSGRGFGPGSSICSGFGFGFGNKEVEVGQLKL